VRGAESGRRTGRRLRGTVENWQASRSQQCVRQLTGPQGLKGPRQGPSFNCAINDTLGSHRSISKVFNAYLPGIDTTAATETQSTQPTWWIDHFQLGPILISLPRHDQRNDPPRKRRATRSSSPPPVNVNAYAPSQTGTLTPTPSKVLGFSSGNLPPVQRWRYNSGCATIDE